MKLKTALITTLALLASLANADVVVTKNGSTINGAILGIDAGRITVKTDFAGEIVIDQAQVASFTTDNPLYLTVANGSTYLGPVAGDASGLSVSSESGSLTTDVASVTESWQPGTQSPSSKRQAAAVDALKRKWAYEAAFDFTGKSGNSESTGLAAAFRATLKGAEDKLEFFAATNFEETDDAKSADDFRAGVDYSNNFSNKYNWYVRSEFGRDVVKGIETYSAAAAGFGYTFSDTATRSLNVRGGLGYRFESYEQEDRDSSNLASLDFGLLHKETYAWGVLVNRLTITPAIEDFGNFRLNHDSSVELPLKAEGWSIRAGVSNTYDSEADLSDKEELDTTYYLRMVLKWL